MFKDDIERLHSAISYLRNYVPEDILAEALSLDMMELSVSM